MKNSQYMSKSNELCNSADTLREKCAYKQAICEYLNAILSDRNNPNADETPFSEKAFWYTADGGGTENGDIGFVEGAVGWYEASYEWDYFEIDLGAAKASGCISGNLLNGAGASAAFETIYATAYIKIPMGKHELKIGLKGNLGAWGANAIVGATTEIGFSNGIGGSFVISWD